MPDRGSDSAPGRLRGLGTSTSQRPRTPSESAAASSNRFSISVYGTGSKPPAWKGWQRRRRRRASTEPLRKAVPLDRLAGVDRARRLEPAGRAEARARWRSCRNREDAVAARAGLTHRRAFEAREPCPSVERIVLGQLGKRRPGRRRPDVDDDLRRRPEAPRGSAGRSRAGAASRGCAPRRPPSSFPRRFRCGDSPRPCARGETAGGGVRTRGPRRRSTLRILFAFEGGRRGRRSPARPGLSSHREFLAPLAAARRQHGASGPGPHPHEKPVRALATPVVGLKGPLHKEPAS